MEYTIKTNSIDESKAYVLWMLDGIKDDTLSLETISNFIRNNSIFLNCYMTQQGYSQIDIKEYFESDMIFASSKPTLKEFKRFCKLTFSSYPRGTKKIFMIVDDIGDLTIQEKKGVCILPLSFHDILEFNIQYMAYLEQQGKI